VTSPSSPYRNELDALRERKDSLERELAEVRAQTSHIDELRARGRALDAELAAVEARLRESGAKRALPLLDQIRVASPCKADWNEMVGDERARFCLSCEKNVYNLSSMQRDEAEAFLNERLGGEICVRFYQRADGTILTQDCPEGVKKKRRKKLALSVAGAGAMAAAAWTALAKGTGAPSDQRMGAVAVLGEMPAMPPVGTATGAPVEVKGEAEAFPVAGGIMLPPPADTAVKTPHVPQTKTPKAPPAVKPPVMKMGKPSLVR